MEKVTCCSHPVQRCKTVALQGTETTASKGVEAGRGCKQKLMLYFSTAP